MKKLLISLAVVMMTSMMTSCYNAAPAEAPEVNESEIVINNIMARRSIRKYKEQTISRDTLDLILKCGINAPNGMNQQSYEVKVVDDPASCALLAEQVKGLYKAPAYVFIAAQDNYDGSKVDVGLLSENICLSATALGIGSINLMMPVRSLLDNPELLAKLGFDEHFDLVLALALGYADEAPEARPRNAEKVQYITIAE